MNISIPEFSLVVLMGASGSGKSTFAREHFSETEIVSSDECRGIVSDDPNNQDATKDAFDLLHYIIRKRLARKRLTVVDATNVQAEARKPLLALAREYDCLPVTITLDLPRKVCEARNAERSDRNFGPHVVRRHIQQLRRSVKQLKREGFRHRWTLSSVEEVEAVKIERAPLWTNKKHENGPFDIIGDVHGCLDELLLLLEKLGYKVQQLPGENASRRPDFQVTPPEGRRAIFVGDLVDRGPDTPGVLRLVMHMISEGHAFCVSGNHDVKLLRKLSGKKVQIKHGLAESLEQLSTESEEFIEDVKGFLKGLISHYVFSDGDLVVAHAGMKEEYQGRASGRVRTFSLYGETTGEVDEFGLPIRYAWAEDYRGKAHVVYGHTPIPEAEWLNRTICIDTGCVFGGELTALRYPEKELVSVPAAKVYCEPIRPLLEKKPTSDFESRERQDLLDIEDVIGKRVISTSLQKNITIREGHASAALEVMSRFSVDPRWLIYLPPTMSPTATSKRTDYLEYPEEAFSYYAKRGVKQVVCEEKHMGSRVVVVICKTPEVASERFGGDGEQVGVCYTRTGRRFFNDLGMEHQLLERLQAAIGKAGMWEAFDTEWFCLDCELMPWSAKAQELLKVQYAPVGVSASIGMDAVLEALSQSEAAGVDVSELKSRFEARQSTIEPYRAAYRQYCWKVDGLEDLKLAPFHLLASEGKVHIEETHLWHMEQLERFCREDSDLFMTTAFRVIDVGQADSVKSGAGWWESMTEKGGEGMVVKPLHFVHRTSKGIAQPAVKCRGREYLRIIYGPEYTLPEHLERLRKRGLSLKRSLALREFALGIEGLERFVRNEPLYRVHECVYGVLALESEPVDPRL